MGLESDCKKMFCAARICPRAHGCRATLPIHMNDEPDAADPSRSQGSSTPGVRPGSRIFAISRKLIGFLGLERGIVGMLTMVVLVGMGERMAEQFLPLFLVALGAGPLVVGGLQALDNGLSAVYSLPGGYMSEYLGVKRSLLIFNVLAIAGYALVILIPHPLAVLAGAVLFLSWSSISRPATMSLIGRSLPKEKQVMGVSIHSLVRRVPMALGPIVCGVLIDWTDIVTGVRIGFGAAILMAIVALIFQQTLIEDDRALAKQARQTPAGIPNPIAVLRGTSPAFQRLLISDIFIRFCEQIPYAFVVLWCMQRVSHPVSALEFGGLRAVEMVVAIAIYVPVAALADRFGKRPFVLITFVFFTAFPVVLYFSQSFWPLVFAFVVRGLKEFGDPSRKALIMELAPEGRRTIAFGAYYFVRDMFQTAGALLGGLLWGIDPRVNFGVAFACGIVGTVWYAITPEPPDTAPGDAIEAPAKG